MTDLFPRSTADALRAGESAARSARRVGMRPLLSALTLVLVFGAGVGVGGGVWRGGPGAGAASSLTDLEEFKVL